MVLLVLFLGTIGYVAAGVLITSMTMQTRSKEVFAAYFVNASGAPIDFAGGNGRWRNDERSARVFYYSQHGLTRCGL